MWSVFLKYCLKVKGKHAVREENKSIATDTTLKKMSKKAISPDQVRHFSCTSVFILFEISRHISSVWLTRRLSPPRELPVWMERLEFVSAVKKSFLFHLWLPLAVFLPGPKTFPSSSVLSHLVSLTSSNSERSQGQSVHIREPKGLSAALRFAISSVCLLFITCIKSNSKHPVGLYNLCGNAHQLLRNFCLRIA